MRRPVRLGWAAGFSIAMVSAGGGTVLFPSGEWMSGKIPMKSNLTLEITSDATLLDAPLTSLERMLRRSLDTPELA